MKIVFLTLGMALGSFVGTIDGALATAPSTMFDPLSDWFAGYTCYLYSQESYGSPYVLEDTLEWNGIDPFLTTYQRPNQEPREISMRRIGERATVGINKVGGATMASSLTTVGIDAPYMRWDDEEPGVVSRYLGCSTKSHSAPPPACQDIAAVNFALNCEISTDDGGTQPRVAMSWHMGFGQTDSWSTYAGFYLGGVPQIFSVNVGTQRDEQYHASIPSVFYFDVTDPRSSSNSNGVSINDGNACSDKFGIKWQKNGVTATAKCDGVKSIKSGTCDTDYPCGGACGREPAVLCSLRNASGEPELQWRLCDKRALIACGERFPKTR